MSNENVKYSILGGPGSGKVGQCENYLSGHPGFVHTNANALLLMNHDKKGNYLEILDILWV